MDNYKVLELIGEGSFGRVFRGKCFHSGDIVALKLIPKNKQLENFRRECDIQKGISHPHIVRMIDSFETPTEFVVVSEYIPLQLFKFLEQDGPFNESKVRSIAGQLSSALEYLHSHHIIHRDMKPQNVLLTEDTLVVKLCDFGFSRRLDLEAFVVTSVKGTPLYMAPELLEQCPYSHTADLWSLGCILYELLSGRPPFYTDSVLHLVGMVCSEPVKWPTKWSVECIDFLQGLLQKDPCQRRPWPDILSHSWIRDVMDIDLCKLSLASAAHSSLDGNKNSSITNGKSQKNMKSRFHRKLVEMVQSIARKSEGSHKIPLDVSENADYAVTYRANQKKHDVNLHSGSDVLLVNCRHQGGTSSTTVELNREDQSSKTDECVNLKLPSNFQDDIRAINVSCNNPSLSQELHISVDVKQGNEIDLAVKADVGDRKDSMVNYMSGSVCSLRRESEQLSGIEYGSPCSNASITSSTNRRPDNFALSMFNSHERFEGEGWCKLVNQTLACVLGCNLEFFDNCHDFTIVCSLLRNPLCSLKILDSVSTILLLPFTIIEDGDWIHLSEVYLKGNVVHNLLCASKLLLESGTCQSELGKDHVDVLAQLLQVVCYLTYKEVAFLHQLCESSDIVLVMSKCLILVDILPSLVVDTLSIMTHILRCGHSGGSLIELVFYDIGETEIRMLFITLMTHTDNLIRACVCTLLAYIACCTPQLLAVLIVPVDSQFVSELLNLQADACDDVRKNASFAVSSLATFTNVIITT